MFRIETTEEPQVEPVDLATAKLYARVDIDDDDQLITMFIESARRYCEKYCDRSFITQTKKIWYDADSLCLRGGKVVLPVRNVQSIDNISSFDNDNDGTEIDSDNYYLSGSRVVFVPSYVFPSNLRECDSFSFEVVVGYGDDPEDVPMPIREAILRHVAHTYQNREAIYDSVNGTFNNNVPHSITALLQGYRHIVI